MKRTIQLVLFLMTSQLVFAQLVITEIMYNPPESGEDTTEYIEILNIGNATIDLTEYTLTEAVDLVFGNIVIESGAYLVVTKSSQAFASYYGFEAIQWENGSLGNSGENIVLSNAQGDIIDEVTYDDGGDWPAIADGNGYSVELCDPYKDNSLGNNWKASNKNTGLVINGLNLFASPGALNEVECEDQIDYTIDVLGLQFSPKNMTINLGETVQWINVSGGNHNVNGTHDAYPENPIEFFSGAPSNENWVFTFTFDIPGIYKYKCDLHSALGMNGTIEVLPMEAASLSINEIMYNDPGAADSLEFIEIYNHGNSTLNLTDFTFESDEISFTFPATIVEQGKFVVLCKNNNAFKTYFGFDAIQWESGALKNSGDHVYLKTADGVVVDEVHYDDIIPWPTLGDGFGYSINLCQSTADNMLSENWQENPFSAGFEFEGTEIFANPGVISYCSYDISEISQTDESGKLINENIGVELNATVHGVNLRPSGIQMTVIDDLNDGIALYSGSNNFGYDVQEGDKLIAIGRTTQYNGLVQINLDSILFFGHQHDLFEAEIVTELNESTESQIVKLKNVSLVNPGDWGNGSSGFNVEVTDGNNTFSIRIDNDVDLYNYNYPTGTFDISGIGSQYDNSEPYFDGYQLMPRYKEDIDPFVPNAYPKYSIGLVTTIDSEGKADSLTTKCEIEGVVYGINFSPSGFSFTMIDENNDGINIYSGSNNTGYVVQEGDLIRVKGTIDQYNGLIEMKPDEIELVSSGVNLFDPTEVTILNEDTESQLIRLAYLSLVDETEWKSGGSSFNVKVTNGINEFTIRIDSDCELSTASAPTGSFHMTGIGAQYDSSAPFDSGYQLFPRYGADLDLVGNAGDHLITSRLILQPNPTSGYINYEGDLAVKSIQIFDMTGKLQRVMHADNKNNQLDISGLNAGMYQFIFISDEQMEVHKVHVSEK